MGVGRAVQAGGAVSGGGGGWAVPGPGWMAHAIVRPSRISGTTGGLVSGRTACGKVFRGPEVVDLFTDRCARCLRLRAVRMGAA